MYNFSTPNFVQLAGNISRVYEIAKLGNHTVKIVPSENCNVEDIELLNTFYGFTTSDNPDMIVELCYSDVDVLIVFTTRGKSETLEQINERLSRVRAIDVSPEIDTVSLSLLKTAITKLKLGVNDVLKIYALSKTISRLENCNQIKVEHVAEAIKYRSF